MHRNGVSTDALVERLPGRVIDELRPTLHHVAVHLGDGDDSFLLHRVERERRLRPDDAFELPALAVCYLTQARDELGWRQLVSESLRACCFDLRLRLGVPLGE